MNYSYVNMNSECNIIICDIKRNNQELRDKKPIKTDYPIAGLRLVFNLHYLILYPLLH